MKLPSFDGFAENCDKLEMKWAEVGGLSNALGDCLDPNMSWNLLLTT